MPIASILRRLPPLPTPFRPPTPPVAVEIGEEHVAFARAGSGGGSPVAWFVGDVPPGSLRSSPVHPNVLAPAALEGVLRAGRDRVAPGGGPVALCLPDALARVALVTVDVVPSRRDEILELVAWRLKKTLPFRMDEAVLDAQAFPAASGKHVVLALVARRRIIAEHEALLEPLGFHVGLVTISTLALASRIPEDAGDVMLINVGSGWFSVLITRGGDPLFFRSKSVPDGERTAAGRDWFVGNEIFPTLEYYRTRLAGAGLSRVFLHVSGPGWDALRQEVAEDLQDVAIERLGPPSIDGPVEAAERLGAADALAARPSAPVGDAA